MAAGSGARSKTPCPFQGMVDKSDQLDQPSTKRILDTFDSLSPAGQIDMLAILQASQADKDGKKVSRGNNKEAKKKKKTKGNSNVVELSRSSCTGTDKNRKTSPSPVRKLVISKTPTTPKGTKRISKNPIKPPGERTPRIPKYQILEKKGNETFESPKKKQKRDAEDNLVRDILHDLDRMKDLDVATSPLSDNEVEPVEQVITEEESIEFQTVISSQTQQNQKREQRHIDEEEQKQLDREADELLRQAEAEQAEQEGRQAQREQVSRSASTGQAASTSVKPEPVVIENCSRAEVDSKVDAAGIYIETSRSTLHGHCSCIPRKNKTG